MKKSQLIIISAVALSIVAGFGVYHLIPEPDAQTVGAVFTERVALPDDQKLYEMVDGSFVVTGVDVPLPETVVADIVVVAKPASVVAPEDVPPTHSGDIEGQVLYDIEGQVQSVRSKQVHKIIGQLSRQLGRDVALVHMCVSLGDGGESDFYEDAWCAYTTVEGGAGINPGEQTATLALAQAWAATHDSTAILID
jgi:hypothetical protein